METWNSSYFMLCSFLEKLSVIILDAIPCTSHCEQFWVFFFNLTALNKKKTDQSAVAPPEEVPTNCRPTVPPHKQQARAKLLRSTLKRGANRLATAGGIPSLLSRLQTTCPCSSSKCLSHTTRTQASPSCDGFVPGCLTDQPLFQLCGKCMFGHTTPCVRQVTCMQPPPKTHRTLLIKSCDGTYKQPATQSNLHVHCQHKTRDLSTLFQVVCAFQRERETLPMAKMLQGHSERVAGPDELIGHAKFCLQIIG